MRSLKFAIEFNYEKWKLILRIKKGERTMEHMNGIDISRWQETIDL